MRLLASILLICLSLSIFGCAKAVTLPYGVYDDKRKLDTIKEDTVLAYEVKKQLSEAGYSGSRSLDVFCYYGRIFLIGESSTTILQNKAVEIAKKIQKVKSVQAHWFRPELYGDDNLLLATKVRTNLISADGLSSTRVDTVVNAGRVVLLGVVSNKAEEKRAIKAAEKTTGVRQVISYLMLPQVIIPSPKTKETPQTKEILPPKENETIAI